MKQTLVLAAMLTSMTVAVSTSFAQKGMGPDGGARRGGRTYDLNTVETIRGEVLSVEQIHGTGGKSGRGYGIHLIVKTDKEEIAVHLGPGWYIEKQSLKIVPKDTIEVRGSRIMSEGKPAIIAAEVKKGDQVLKLRDTNGVPAWSGRRGR
jgi:hypothetical protein